MGRACVTLPAMDAGPGRAGPGRDRLGQAGRGPLVAGSAPPAVRFGLMCARPDTPTRARLRCSLDARRRAAQAVRGPPPRVKPRALRCGSALAGPGSVADPPGPCHAAVMRDSD